jgi:uracil permease
LIIHKVDLSKTRNIIIVSVTLTTGIGGAILSWGNFSLSGIGLAAIIGLVLNLILPQDSKEEKDNTNDNSNATTVEETK